DMTRRVLRSVVLLALALLVLGGACAPAAAPTPTPTKAPAAASTTAAQATKPPAPAPTTPAAPTATPKPVTVKYGTTPRIAWFWADFIADSKGFYKAEGVTREEITFQTSNELTAAMLGGSVNVGPINPSSVVTANQKGADLTIVSSMIQKPLFSLVAKPEFKSYDQLKGKKIGVFALKGSGSTALLVRLLAAKGLKSGDYDMIAVGGTPQRFAALKSGAVEAALLTQPQDFQIVEEGFNLLGFTTDATKLYNLASVVVSKKWATANQDALVRFLRAQYKATLWLYDAKNKAEAIKILADAVKVDPKYATKTYELYVEQLKAIPPDSAIAVEEIQAVIDIGQEAGELSPPLPKASDLIDNSFLEAARKG
ncbi:MAG: ABC transporter substrate-binding protein, partial [Dehalococcoidia bacterium]|nr:ABC transporter substrate-binding protein [Dehalococcoidia bacterium]